LITIILTKPHRYSTLLRPANAVHVLCHSRHQRNANSKIPLFSGPRKRRLFLLLLRLFDTWTW